MKVSMKFVLGLFTSLQFMSTAIAAAPVVNKQISHPPCTPYSDTNTIPSHAVYQNQDTTIRIGGRLKADFYNDFNGKQPLSTAGLESSTIPLEKWDYDARRTHNFNTGMTGTRLSLDGLYKYGSYLSYGYFELDFNGGAQAPRTTNSYLPRIRHAYAEISDTNKTNVWLVGQTWSNFANPDVRAWTTNDLSPILRQAQVRYTRKLASHFTIAMAAERPNTTSYYYTSPAVGTATSPGGNISPTYADNDTNTGFNKSSLPDFTIHAKYQQDTTQFSLRGLVRSLELKTIASSRNTNAGGQGRALNNFSSRQVGYGLGAAAKFKIFNPVTLMFQVQGGKGIGRYIDELANSNTFDSYFQYQVLENTPIASRFEAIKAINFVAGANITWLKNLETNMGASYTKVSLPSNIALNNLGITNSSIPNITGSISLLLPNTRLQRYHVNLVYTILPKTFGIVEMEQYYREAGFPRTYNGKDTRLVFSFIRQF